MLSCAIIGLIAVAYYNTGKRSESIVFTQRAMLTSTWNGYKKAYLEPGTFRTVDKQREGVTTSEGQSYTMLRAVWMDDKEVFDKSWQWTKDNLQRDDDKLFSWLFGKRADGTFGILTEQGGGNTATDADSDIAMALLFAYARWGDENYLNEAKAIINDIWEKEVVIVNGKPYLAANNVEKTSTSEYIVINPSYFSPYAYRMFAEVDPAHPWESLITTSYEVLEKSMSANLDKPESANLPPNWIVMHERTGEIKASPVSTLETNYGYDAIRVPWRIGLDWQWYKEPRAKALLERMSHLKEEWRDQKALYTVYSHDGQPLAKQQSPAHYGTSLGYFMVESPRIAEDIYTKKLALLYSPDIQSWKEQLSYYDDNWAWFGLALYSDQLPNLFETITSR